MSENTKGDWFEYGFQSTEEDWYEQSFQNGDHLNSFARGKKEMQVSQPNNVKIYNLSAGKSLPEVGLRVVANNSVFLT